MADELARITNPDNTAIDLYRSSDAAPENLDQMRFWVINELRRIQDGFVSTDAVLKILAGGLGEIDPGGGEKGDKGDQGDKGDPGRSVQIYKQPSEPLQALAGDEWFVTG